MFNKKTDNAKTNIDDVMAELYAHMLEFSPSQDEYQTILDRLSKLHDLKNAQRSRSVSPDTLAVVLGNLAGIGLILSYEHTHAVTSKALGFVMKAVR